MATRAASCSCGQLSIVVEGEPLGVGVCHCLSCQQRTGSGDSDTLTPLDRSEEIAGARLVVVPQSGHSSTLEQPAAVNRALVDWIRDPRRTS